MKRPVFNKRRIFLFVLLFPTILSIVILSVIAIRTGSSKGFAKKWLKENRPGSVLLDAEDVESTVNGVTSKALVCTCLDTNIGMIYQQEFDRSGGAWIAAADSLQNSYDYMLGGYQSVNRLAASLAAQSLPTAIYSPDQYYGQCCLVLAENVAPEQLEALWAKVSACAAADPTISVRMIAAPKEICDAVLNADRIGFQRKFYDSAETGSVNELAQMIHKRKKTLMTCELNNSGSTGSAATTAEAIKTIQAQASTGSDTVWEITSRRVSAYTFS